MKQPCSGERKGEGEMLGSELLWELLFQSLFCCATCNLQPHDHWQCLHSYQSPYYGRKILISSLYTFPLLISYSDQQKVSRKSGFLSQSFKMQSFGVRQVISKALGLGFVILFFGFFFLPWHVISVKWHNFIWSALEDILTPFPKYVCGTDRMKTKISQYIFIRCSVQRISQSY